MTEALLALFVLLVAVLIGYWLQRREDRRFHSTGLITTISTAGFESGTVLMIGEQPMRVRTKQGNTLTVEQLPPRVEAAMDAMRRIPKENGTMPPCGKNE